MHEEFYATGTVWHIHIEHTDSILIQETLQEIKHYIEIFEQTYSRFREKSLIDDISKKEGVYLLPLDALPMFTMYRTLYDISAGLVTPLIGQALHDTGYDASYTLKPKDVIRPVPAWDDVMKYIPDTRTLTVYRPVQLDLGAIGKGYLIDNVQSMLEKKGFTSYTIDAGRDIYHKGIDLTIALENPFDTTQAIGTACITKGSICGSSGNRRNWSTYTHIINPHSLTSPTHIKGVWIFAETAILADSLTTAIFFTPLSTLKTHFSFEHVIVYEDGSAVISEGFPGKLF